MTENLIELFDQRLGTVGFSRAAADDPVVQEVPPGVTVWAAPYARLVLWAVPAMTPDAVQKESQNAESAMDKALRFLKAEPGAVMDGYVVLSLPCELTDDLARMARQVQLERRTVRRTVVWRSEAGWKGLDALPIIDLPQAKGGQDDGLWPSLEEAEGALIGRLLDQRQSGNPVAQEDIERLRREVSE